MTIALPSTDEIVDGELEEDEFHMLWLVNRSRRGSGRLPFLLAAALHTGCRIVAVTPAE